MPTPNLNPIYISERLRGALDNIPLCPLTVVSAPMGYGKTTAIDWFLDPVRKSGRAVVRVGIYSDSLPIFWKSLQNAFLAAGLDIFEDCPLPAGMSDLAFISDRLAGLHIAEVYVFLDDFHLLKSRIAGNFIVSLAMNLPKNIHLIIATRERFPESGDVVRLSARLNPIGAELLKLDRRELAVFVRRCGVKLSEAQLDELLRVSEGWFSAVYISLRFFSESGALPCPDTDILELFSAALIDPLSADEREFLAVMSLADEFTADEAAEVTRIENARGLLATLSERNAFVTRIDGTSYRFHHMLRVCARKLFEKLPKERRDEYLDRFGAHHEARGEYIKALGFYAACRDYTGWLRVVADDAGENLASCKPGEVISVCEDCPRDCLIGNPRAILVLMRRFFSWGNIPLMLGLSKLIDSAVEGGNLTQTERSDLLGERDLIMSFLRYNDIAGMSRLHRSACEKMSRPAVSIKTYGSFTFGSPSVLMMFHRTPGGLDEEVRLMNESMPFYYRVTEEHGAGAELVMAGEAAFMRGNLGDAELLCEKAMLRADSRNQRFVRLSRDFLALGLERFGVKTSPVSDPVKLRERHDATLMLTYDSLFAWHFSLLGLTGAIPETFALDGRNILNPAKPMLLAIENQALLARGEYVKVAARQELLTGFCSKLSYLLVSIIVKIQTAAALEALGKRPEADSLLMSAISDAAPDMIAIPFAENYRYIKELLPGSGGFADRIRRLGEIFESKRLEVYGSAELSKAAKLLTERELSVAKLAAARLSNREIAARLYLTEGTVKQYLNSVYSKLSLDGTPGEKRAELSRLI